MQSDNKSTFAITHPKLNAFIGVLILLVCLVIVLVLIRFIVIGISSFISWLGTIASHLEAVVIVALISGAASTISVAVASAVSKIIDYKQKRKKYLYQKREKPYQEFIDMVYKIIDSSKENKKYSENEMTQDMLKFSKQLTLWGSNRVIKKWLKIRTSSNIGLSGEETIFVMEDILYAMRKDMGLRKLRKGNLLSFFINDIEKIK